jgi:large subunit ribosomal protein L17
MRHQVRGRKLGRTSSHKLATMRALSAALIKNQKIVTTVAKAKELRRYIEPIITRARKEDTTHNRRQIFSFLNDKEAIKTLYEVVVPEISDRPGGYTRIIKLGNRAGDGAPTAMIEFVDFNDVKPEGKDTKKKRTRRAGRKKSTDDTPKAEAAPVAPIAEDATVVEEEVKADAPIVEEADVEVDETTDEAPETTEDDAPEEKKEEK